MDLQQQQLDDLAGWLTGMEERINQQEPVGSDLEAIKRQVEEHKVRHLLISFRTRAHARLPSSIL
jgi:hypothetical protein